MPTNLELVHNMYAAFARGDVSAVLAGLHSAIEWSEAEHFIYSKDTPYIGHQEVVTGVFAPLATQWDGFSVNPEHFIDGGDTVVALGRYRGAYKATGAAINAQFAHVFQFQDGLVTRFQQYTDTFQFKEAVSGKLGASA